MKYRRGKSLEPGEKRAIVSVKGYFDRNKKGFGITEGSVQLTADALEIGVSTVKRVMANYQRDPLLLDKPPEPKGHPSIAHDDSHEEVIRNFIRHANQKGQYITISSISELIQDKEPDAHFHQERRQERLIAGDLNLVKEKGLNISKKKMKSCNDVKNIYDAFEPTETVRIRTESLKFIWMNLM